MNAEAPSGGRQVRTMLVWAAMTFLIGLALFIAAPKVLGGQSMAVLSGSMSPAIDTGDEVMVVPVKATSIEPGEVAVFNDPDDSGRLLNHRVQRVSEKDGRINVITLGDANTKPEKWSVDADQDVGRVVARVPKLGYVLGRFDRPYMIWIFLLIPALALGISLLISIWRAPEEGADPIVDGHPWAGTGG